MFENIILYKEFFMFVYLGGSGEREKKRETQNPKQAPGSELSAQSPTRGSNSQTTRS